MDRIRILFLHDRLICGGAEQALYDLVCLMDKGKFDITILVLSEGGEWEGKFRAAGICVESVWSCQKKSNNPLIKLENWKKRRRIVGAIQNHNIGLIEACFDTPFDIIVANKVFGDHRFALLSGAKTIKYIHNDLETNVSEREDILRLMKMEERFDKFICVSNLAKASFEKTTGIFENVVALFNPLNSENIKRLSEHSEKNENYVTAICAIGRLTHEKGFERLIRIHKRIYDEGYKHKLVIVGEGPMRELLENVIRSIHCEESVELVGYQANPYSYMKNSRFVVCPSYTEGLSMIAMEALALGIPVVAAVPSIAELFGEESCGIITENDDASLEEGIRQMLQDSVFYEKMKAGAERRSLYFDGKRMVKEIEQEFIELVNS